MEWADDIKQWFYKIDNFCLNKTDIVLLVLIGMFIMYMIYLVSIEDKTEENKRSMASCAGFTAGLLIAFFIHNHQLSIRANHAEAIVRGLTSPSTPSSEIWIKKFNEYKASVGRP